MTYPHGSTPVTGTEAVVIFGTFAWCGIGLLLLQRIEGPHSRFAWPTKPAGWLDRSVVVVLWPIVLVALATSGRL